MCYAFSTLDRGTGVVHGLKRRVDANSLSLFSQPPFAKPGIVFSTFGKLILKEPVVCKRKKSGIMKKKPKRNIY